MNIDTGKTSKEKTPDCSCRHLSVNWMAAGSRLPRSSHGIFLPFTNFTNKPYLTVISLSYLEQVLGPELQQTSVLVL